MPQRRTRARGQVVEPPPLDHVTSGRSSHRLDPKPRRWAVRRIPERGDPAGSDREVLDVLNYQPDLDQAIEPPSDCQAATTGPSGERHQPERRPGEHSEDRAVEIIEQDRAGGFGKRLPGLTQVPTTTLIARGAAAQALRGKATETDAGARHSLSDRLR